MYYLFFFVYVSTLISLWQSTSCQEQHHFTITVTKAINCNISGLKWLIDNVTTDYYYPRTYFSFHHHVTEDIKKLNKFNLYLERCNDRGYDCEDFQNWKLDHFCQIITWKNQVWSEFIRKTRPTIRCPLNKATYESHNASFNIDSFTNWYPELEKYYWKAQLKIWNDKNDIIYCGIVEAYFNESRNRKSLKVLMKNN